MKMYRAIKLITIFCLFSSGTMMAEETIKCPANDFACLNQHIDSAHSIEITKTEKSGTTLIESTTIKLTKSDNSVYTEFSDLQNIPGLKLDNSEKNVEASAHISINHLQAIKKQPNNSIFKKIIQTCPNLRLAANIKKLNGTNAQCTLNEGITVTYAREDIYWCGKHTSCRQGPFPSKMDERLQLFSEGLAPYYTCHGLLIDQIQSICKMNDWNRSNSIIDSFQTGR